MNKPPQFTSFDVVAKLRGMLRQKRIGHGGTLDPMAVGVLPIFLGRATRACDIAPVQDKRYRATLRLGMTTDTQDTTGTVLTTAPSAVTREQLEEALLVFVGDILQLPPMYSAVQVGGQRLYDLARKGIEIERPRRPVTLHSIELLEFDPAAQTALLDVHCSKGTYIRTLCHDVGERLGVGGVLDDLCRTQALGFSLADCVTFEEVAAALTANEFESMVLPVERVFAALPAVTLNDIQTRMYLNGVRLDLTRIPGRPAEVRVRVLDAAGDFLGLADQDEAAGEFIAAKVLVQR